MLLPAALDNYIQRSGASMWCATTNNALCGSEELLMNESYWIKGDDALTAFLVEAGIYRRLATRKG